MQTDTTQVSTHHIWIFSRKKKWRVIICISILSLQQTSYLIISYFLLNTREEKNQQHRKITGECRYSNIQFVYLCKVHKSQNCDFGLSLTFKSPEAWMDFTILLFRINVDDNTKKADAEHSLFLFSTFPPSV